MLEICIKILSMGQSILYSMFHHNDGVRLESFPGLSRVVLVCTKNIMFVENYLEKKANVPTHSHDSEQLTYIVEGKLSMYANGKEHIMQKGDCIILSKNTPHSATALEESFVLDLFMPPRKDLLDEMKK
jgi:quercetin dioxygenase-like cupin family protein